MTQSVFEYSNSMENLPKSVIENSVEYIITLLKEDPSKFQDLFIQKLHQSQQTLLVLLRELGKLNPDLILRLFSKPYLFFNTYEVLSNIITIRNDTVMLSLLDLIGKLKLTTKVDYIFINKKEMGTTNVLTEIVRSSSEKVIIKAFSVVFDFLPNCRDTILKTKHVEYDVIDFGLETSHYKSYNESPIEAAFDRIEYPNVIRYLIDKLDIDLINKTVKSIKKRRLTTSSIANLIKSIPISGPVEEPPKMFSLKIRQSRNIVLDVFQAHALKPPHQSCPCFS